MKTEFKETEIGMLPENWEVKKLETLFHISAGGDLSKISFSKNKSAEYVFPIYSNSLNDKGLYGFSKEYQYEPECITITGRGNVGRAEYRQEPFNAIVRLLVLKPKQKLSCYFITCFINSRLDFSHVGSAVNQLTAPMISQEIVAFPPLQEQSSIAKILFDLDSKIELNQQMNKTLEAISRIIFKHWFIDFEFPNKEGKPFKSSDGEMVFNEEMKRNIPKGWDVKNLSDVSGIVDCLHITKPIETENDAYLLQVFNIVDYGLIDLSKKFHVSDVDYKLWTKNIEVVEGDCIISNAGRVGAIGQIPYWLKSGIGRNITAVRPVTITPTYLVEYLFSKFGQQEIKLQTDSATVLNTLNVRGIKKIKVLIPNEELMKKYERISRPLRKMMEINSLMISDLNSLRDILLTKLMSGKIRVPLEANCA